MSSLLFELNKNNHKHIFELHQNLNEKNPIKLISESNSPNKNNDFHKENEKRFLNKFKKETNKKYLDNLEELNQKLKEEPNDEYINLRYNSDKKINVKLSRNINKELNYDEKELLSPKYINTVRANKFINNNYNKFTPVKCDDNRKFIGGSPLVSHSIDIINNNPFNKKRFKKIVIKRESDIYKILNKNNEDFIKDSIFHRKNINISPIKFNKKLHEKNKNKYNIRKSSYDIPQNEIDFKTNTNSKKELFSELYINNDTKNNIKNIFIESHKDLNRDRINFQYQKDFEPKKIDKEEINKLISLKIANGYFEEKIIPLKIKDFYKSQKQIKENELFLEKKEDIECASNDDLKEYYVEKCGIILEFAYKEDINNLHKLNMEDKGKSIINYNNDPNQILFCLFDGHGGDQVSTYLQKNFGKIMKNYINESDNEMDFNLLFQEIDEEFKNCKYYKNGSTATIIYIRKNLVDNQKILYCINIGDSKCILTQTNGSRKLSYDDLLSDENEYNRIKNESGYIKNGRVCGELMLSRAFGDWEYKPYGVICLPHVTKIEINDKCKYVILASDGIWDVLDDLDVYKFSLSAENSQTLCDEIIKNALERETKDNLSCFVIKLNN